ncbi:hypothetical protein D3C86_1938880 [compost metagenome]
MQVGVRDRLAHAVGVPVLDGCETGLARDGPAERMVGGNVPEKPDLRIYSIVFTVGKIAQLLCGSIIFLCLTGIAGIETDPGHYCERGDDLVSVFDSN